MNHLKFFLKDLDTTIGLVVVLENVGKWQPVRKDRSQAAQAAQAFLIQGLSAECFVIVIAQML